MKRLLIPLLVSISLVMIPLPGKISAAGEYKQRESVYSAQEILENFSQYTPSDIIRYVHSAVDYLQPRLSALEMSSPQQEQQQFKRLIAEFQNHSTLFGSNALPLRPFLVVARCDEQRILAYPIPEFMENMGRKGFLRKYKDVRGKKTVYQLCQQVHNVPEGVWEQQYQWWPQTKVPLPMSIFALEIPDTPYHVEAVFPNRLMPSKKLLKEEKDRSAIP